MCRCLPLTYSLSKTNLSSNERYCSGWDNGWVIGKNKFADAIYATSNSGKS